MKPVFSEVDAEYLEAMLIELRLAADQAIPGPWLFDTTNLGRRAYVKDALGGLVAECPRVGDAAYIADLDPHTLLRLVSSVEALLGAWRAKEKG